jgi:putative flippase GtrA
MKALPPRALAESTALARGWAYPGCAPLLAQFLRFGTVGVLGFGVDTGIVYGLRGPLGLYAAGMVSYFVAATVNWACNRAWTFRGRGSRRAHREWALFVLANSLGLVLNRGTYVALIATVPLTVAYPVLAVAAGAVAGMFANFTLSRQLVFR